MRFALKDHAGEGMVIARALADAGHVSVSDASADLFLIDYDCPMFGFRDLIRFFRKYGAVVLQYPHGASANLGYDALYEPDPDVDGQLTVGTGEVEFLKRIGVERPARPIGWYYCQQLPFRARPEPRRVLLAPTHPNGDGSMLDARRRDNADAFAALTALPVDLTVRFVGTLEQNGIEYVDGVRYVQGTMDLTTAEIDGADVVVAGAGTFPALSVARGAPTVMYGQERLCVWGIEGEELKPLPRYHLYRDVTRYPIDVDGGELSDVLRLAAASDAPIREWRDRWIGEPFSADRVARTIEAFVEELAEAKETKVGVPPADDLQPVR